MDTAANTTGAAEMSTTPDATTHRQRIFNCPGSDQRWTDEYNPDLAARGITTTTEAICHHCGDHQSVKRDGTFYRHRTP